MITIAGGKGLKHQVLVRVQSNWNPHIAGGKQNGTATLRAVWWFQRKLKRHLLGDSATKLLSILPNNKNLCSPNIYECLLQLYL